MSKYVKLEDIEAVLADKHMNRPLDSDRWVIGDIGKSIADLPTTEIVHCKDCVHCADDWNGNQPQFTCELGLCGESVYPDDYCSYGEKQVASKLKNPDDSLFTEELETCKEQKSKLESDDAVSKAVFDQIKWERDTALQTLEEHGIGLGERKVDTPTKTPTNAPTDLISKRVIQDSLLHRISNLNAQGATSIARELIQFKKFVDGITPVEPKRPNGEWIEHIDDRNGRRYGECPSCHKSILNAIEYDLDGERHIMNFCHNCGCDCRGNRE